MEKGEHFAGGSPGGFSPTKVDAKTGPEEPNSTAQVWIESAAVRLTQGFVVLAGAIEEPFFLPGVCPERLDE
ncbi:hypothetical protein DOTSEDRAFT_72160 [Dothistroma septosporum NZE10]|uniref:Uncharacterized protein n=1 Tax=Dothistroma septosporum (strain NZE10 / CBS 128990) TaxID=675120 RepID=N1PMJ2_DOTSN|nr:hypothetical protein DOTSEDRAFT_72160 [Dothistroma septosporum NZE10]